MRRSVFILMTVAAMLALSAGAALAAVIQCQGGICEGTLNDDTMTGTAGGDHMYGKSGKDVMRARGGSDSLNGGLNNDTLDGAAGSDRYWFEDAWGEDTISVDGEGTLDTLIFLRVTSSVTIDLGSSTNVKAYSGTNKVKWSSSVIIEDVVGGSAGDSIKGNGSANDILGLSGNDIISGHRGDDWMYGDGSTEDLLRGVGDDRLSGGPGNDTLHGDGGRDTLAGDDDNDTIHAVDEEADQISCGPGFDTVHYDQFHDTFTASDCEEKKPYAGVTLDDS